MALIPGALSNKTPYSKHPPFHTFSHNGRCGTTSLGPWVPGEHCQCLERGEQGTHQMDRSCQHGRRNRKGDDFGRGWCRFDIQLGCEDARVGPQRLIASCWETGSVSEAGVSGIHW